MASAVRLAAKGFRVDVYERNSYPGGKLSSFQQNGFSFDAGPSLFTQPENIQALFKLSGENINDYFSYQQLATTCNYFFENGKQINASANIEKFANDMQLIFDEDPIAIKKYLAISKDAYNNIGTIFLDYSLHQFKTFFNKRIWKALKSLRFSFLLKSLYQYNHKYFKSPETIQLFSRYATYNGSNPYQARQCLA